MKKNEKTFNQEVEHFSRVLEAEIVKKEHWVKTKWPAWSRSVANWRCSAPRPTACKPSIAYDMNWKIRIKWWKWKIYGILKLESFCQVLSEDNTPLLKGSLGLSAWFTPSAVSLKKKSINCFAPNVSETENLMTIVICNSVTADILYPPFLSIRVFDPT